MNQNISGWCSRGYIPHFNEPSIIQSITFRLYDAVPEKIIVQWKKELTWTERILANDPRQVILRKRIAKYEDSGHGACWLRSDPIAAIVEDTFLCFDGERYRILAWCIMPNHIHAIIETWEFWPLANVVHSWKSYTAHIANKLLCRSGQFWFREFHDRFIRSDEHFAQAVEYVENNPVKAGLVDSKEEWRWSSAWKLRNTIPGAPALPG
jgi:putative transposase